VYVANFNDNTVSVVDSAVCNATDTRGCDRAWPTIQVAGALALALDSDTRTLYVTAPAVNLVSVINAATCNATDTSGCGQPPATLAVGGGPGLLAIDQATDTIYVPNGNDGTVSVINGATCNAGDTSGCGQTVPTVAAGPGAVAVGIDPRTHTVYVANGNDGTVSVIDGAICNATDTSGCGQTPVTVTVGPGPVDAVVDQSTNTVYVPTFGASLGAVSMINASTCNGTNSSGCGQPPPTAPIGSNPNWAAENPVTHTLYVTNQDDSTVSAIDTSTCNATTTSGCRTPAPAMAIGFNAGGVDVDPTTDTVYAASQNNGTISVLDGANCNATKTTGCTQFAPTAPLGAAPQPIAVDPATGTIYVGNHDANTVSVINAAACNIAHPSGCDRSWPTVSVGGGPFYGIAVDQQTDTIYVTNRLDSTVSVIDGGTCNAHDSAGCGQSPPTTSVGRCPKGAVADRARHTLYVVNGCDNTVSVINTAVCNAHTISGCGQAWPTIAVGNSPLAAALDPVTGTLYVGNLPDRTVSVINAASCNAQVASGCSQSPPTVQVQDSPRSLAIDERTNTIYVANTGSEFFDTGYANVTSSVSMIDGSACNGHNTTGCGRTPSSYPVGGFPWGIAVDQATDRVYVTSIVDSSVALVDGAACNARRTSGCRPQVLPDTTGGWPTYIGLDPAMNTIYVPDNVDGAMSLYWLP
jgi:DNA-binding beta-propeller fold protein YncE